MNMQFAMLLTLGVNALLLGGCHKVVVTQEKSSPSASAASASGASAAARPTPTNSLPRAILRASSPRPSASARPVVKGPLITKKLKDLKEADLVATAKALGWGDALGIGRSKGGGNTSITVSAQQENPKGLESATGKRYEFKQIKLNTYPNKKTATALAHEAIEQGFVIKQQGNAYLGVKYTLEDGPEKEKARKDLKIIFEK